MPKRRAVDGLHAAFTDHFIRRPGERSEAKSTDQFDLIPFWPGTGSQRDLALAYADVASKSRREADFLRAFKYLKLALPEAPHDGELLVNLGYLYDLSGDPTTALAMYQAALKLNPNSITALTNLAQHLAVSGREGDAIHLWQRAVRADPGLATPGLNLARVFLQMGDVASARKAVDDVLRFTPDSAKALQLRKQITETRK